MSEFIEKFFDNIDSAPRPLVLHCADCGAVGAVSVKLTTDTIESKQDSKDPTMIHVSWSSHLYCTVCNGTRVFTKWVQGTFIVGGAENAKTI